MSDVELPAVAGSLEPEIPAEELEPIATVEPDWVVLDNGDASLDLTDASRVAAEIGAIVILLAGAHDAGKTTLLVELYAQFLDGPCRNLRFAGSKTLDALDYRQFASRLGSGNEVPNTERTGETDMRLLHLRLSDQKGNHKALMPSDLKGELFEDLIAGVDSVDSIIPLARRADRTIVLVDGERIADPALRQSATLRVRQLIGALTESGGLCLYNPLLIALSKKDLLDETSVAWWDVEAQGLVEHARRRGLTNVERMEVAARPANHTAPIGLVDLLEWMWASIDRLPVTAPKVAPPSDRVFLLGTLA